MRLDPDSPLSPYRQIADWLRQEIASGALAPGERIPTESEMMRSFGVSRMTVRYAKTLLEGEGLIIARQGSGAFVRTNRTPCPTCGGKGWLEG